MVEERIKELERALETILQVQRDHEARLYGNKDRGDIGLVDMVRWNRRLVVGQMVIAALFVLATGVQLADALNLMSVIVKFLSI